MKKILLDLLQFTTGEMLHAQQQPQYVMNPVGIQGFWDYGPGAGGFLFLGGRNQAIYYPSSFAGQERELNFGAVLTRFLICRDI
jgi:hypothetical protein